MERIKTRAKIALLTAALIVIDPLAAGAQTNNLGQQVITGSTRALSDLVSNIVTLLQVVMGLGAIIVLAIVIFQVFKGEREAAQKLAWWVVGLTLGFTLLSLVAGLIPKGV